MEGGENIKIPELKTKKEWLKIDPFKRYQRGLVTQDFFPSIKGKCACGCGNDLPPRKRRWFSEDCHTACYIQTSIIKGDTGIIRDQLFKRDEGACNNCGEITDNWDADHIIPVHKGGGACTLDNFQTLCKDCHKEKTEADLSNQIP